MSANDKQVGGEHYKAKYQHWDFVCDARLHYLIGCATKYITRHKKKNGKQDLEKSVHYLQKATERGVVCMQGSIIKEKWRLFCDSIDLDLDENDIMVEIYHNRFSGAIVLIEQLIEKEYTDVV